MYLEGQGAHREKGYAMAALLVTLAVMAVLMSAAMPVWKHQAQREKEHELVFRLTQYAIAINLWRAKLQSNPPNVDILVQQRFLRKKYKDPITGEDFEVIGAAQQPGMEAQRGVPGGGQRGQMPGQSAGFVAGGIIGVRSKSKESSIRVWRGATIYQQFTSLLAAPPQVPGAGRGDGRGGPGQPGMQQPGMPGFPGGRGGPGGGRNPFGGMGPGGAGPGGGRGLSPSPGGPGGGRAGTGPGGRGRGF